MKYIAMLFCLFPSCSGCLPKPAGATFKVTVYAPEQMPKHYYTIEQPLVADNGCILITPAGKATFIYCGPTRIEVIP